MVNVNRQNVIFVFIYQSKANLMVKLEEKKKIVQKIILGEKVIR